MSNPFVISADEIKKYFPKYSPKTASEFHRESARLADKIFENTIKIIPQKVIILGGGTASGKTEYLSQYLHVFGKAGGIFFDGTLPNFEGAQIKLKNVLKNKRELEIHFIFPKNLQEAFTVFMNRDRQFSDEHFYRTHSNSRKTLLEIVKKFPEVRIRLIESRFTKNIETMIFEEKILNSKAEQIDFLQNFQYTEKEIIQVVL
ncbi:MAG: zeta toxin family protein [Candidatus Peregrinibacteria bacterium]|nr:zeta toxin family protein [Candidatus Peregrinibacteria bacterium]